MTGRLLDVGHLPVISLLAAVGLACAVARSRRAGPERALVAMFCACLLLSFGRTTFGPLISIVPGHADVFFRRFLMGAELAAIYLAGLGAAEAADQGQRLAAVGAGLDVGPAAVVAEPGARGRAALRGDRLSGARVGVPGRLRRGQCRRRHRAASRPAPREAATGRRWPPCCGDHGGGRAYAGSPFNWGQGFTAGAVPMYQYLDSLDTDEIGYDAAHRLADVPARVPLR